MGVTKERVLVTAALPYANGRLHVGHMAGAYIPADIFVRYLRLCGKDVRFVCGSDDHGVAIKISAEKEGKTPSAIAEYYNRNQKEAFEGLGIFFDVYGSTSRSEYHQETSQEFFRALYDAGYFTKESTRQFFDQGRGVFLPDRYVTGTCLYCKTMDQNGDQCENCGKMLDVDSLIDARSTISGNPANIKETVHWFLDLTRFESTVGAWLEKADIREQTRNYVSGLLSSGLVKRSMTRDLDWGISLPLDDPDAEGKVMYVWFDAPIGYISNTKELCAELEGEAGAYERWWKSEDAEIFHFIGEDNTIFHCVIWIAMLSAEGSYQLPKGVIVNQFLNIKFPGQEEAKISKSRGNAVWIEDYLKQGGNPDSLRFYLTSIAPQRARTAYSPEDLIQRHNSELANVVGNFVNRVLSFTHKYFGPAVPEVVMGKVTAADVGFEQLKIKTHHEMTRLLDDYKFKEALEAVMEFARACNRYVDEKAPWATRKDDLEATAVTLAYSINAIKFLAVAFRPFMPFSSEKICGMLQIVSEDLLWEDAAEPLRGGAPLNPPSILFERIQGQE